MRPGSEFGHYVLHDEIASGGMGTVHLGHKRGSGGFSRIVAVKRLNPLMAKEPEFLAMFLDEARLAGRVRHPNVVSTIDVVDGDGEVLIVMDYVQGEPLSQLIRMTAERGQRVAPRIVSAVMSGALYGLHAAHEATDERGQPLRLVHRDVSPQNILVGVDGIARVVDFGVAKAVGRLHSTVGGNIKGKLSYMPPEQLRAQPLDRRADVYSAGVVIWETLTGARLFRGENEPDTITKVLLGDVPRPSTLAADVPTALDNVVMRAVCGDAADRFSTAREMSAALLEACPPAPPHEVGEWVEACAHQTLTRRAARIAELESGSGVGGIGSIRSGDPTQRVTDAEHTAEAPRSQVSSISVSVPRGYEPTRRPATLAIAAGVLALSAAAVFGVRRWESKPPEPASSMPSSAPAVTPSDGSATPEIARPVDGAAPSSTASAAAGPLDPSGSDAAALPTPAAPRKPPAQRAPAGGSADCNPPYVRGSDGRKIWKRECLDQAR